MPKFLPAITTYRTPDWPERIEQLGPLGVTEVAVFLTSLDPAGRRELYDRLARSAVRSVPHVHLRQDMEPWELDLFAERYGTRLFNTHSNPACRQLLDRCRDRAAEIYVENGAVIDDAFEAMAGDCAGLCLDFAHWAAAGLSGFRGYERLPALVSRHRVGCAHLSAFYPAGRVYPADRDGRAHYCPHSFEQPEELDYILRYRDLLPDYVSLELFNPLAEQLLAINRLNDMIDSGEVST